MYLRRNKVRDRRGNRVYLSIAHNVWWNDARTGYAQSRPVVLANFGAEAEIDVEFAREVVAAVERCAPLRLDRRGDAREETLRIAREIRAIEPFLRALASRRLGLTELFPPGKLRGELLDGLIQGKLSDPGGGDRDDVEGVILSVLRADAAAAE